MQKQRIENQRSSEMQTEDMNTSCSAMAAVSTAPGQFSGVEESLNILDEIPEDFMKEMKDSLSGLQQAAVYRQSERQSMRDSDSNFLNSGSANGSQKKITFSEILKRKIEVLESGDKIEFISMKRRLAEKDAGIVISKINNNRNAGMEMLSSIKLPAVASELDITEARSGKYGVMKMLPPPEKPNLTANEFKFPADNAKHVESMGMEILPLLDTKQAHTVNVDLNNARSGENANVNILPGTDKYATVDLELYPTNMRSKGSLNMKRLLLSGTTNLSPVAPELYSNNKESAKNGSVEMLPTYGAIKPQVTSSEIEAHGVTCAEKENIEIPLSKAAKSFTAAPETQENAAIIGENANVKLWPMIDATKSSLASELHVNNASFEENFNMKIFPCGNAAQPSKIHSELHTNYIKSEEKFQTSVSPKENDSTCIEKFQIAPDLREINIKVEPNFPIQLDQQYFVSPSADDKPKEMIKKEEK